MSAFDPKRTFWLRLGQDSFKASGNFAPTFVSTNIETLFGYAPCEYLDNPNFWRERVHPDDLQRAETEVTDLFKNGKHALEYRFCRPDMFRTEGRRGSLVA